MSTGSNGKEDDRARLVRRAERAEADLDLLIGRFALVSVRSGMRAQALQLAEECITENLANGEGVDSQPAVLDAIFDALKYEIADEPDGARPGAKPPIQSTSVSPVGQDDPGQETIDGDPQPLGSAITICTGCGYIVRAGDEGFHRECDDGVLIDYERADDPGQEQGADDVVFCKRCNGRYWITEYQDVQHGTNAIRRDCPECCGDRAAAAAGVRSQGPLLTEEDWQSFPTDPETRDTVLDYLAERGYLAVRDDDSEATR
jgi:hypothetical protein